MANLLHTNSQYTEHIGLQLRTKSSENFAAQWKSLEAKENSTYQQLSGGQATDFPSFMNWIKDLFNMLPQDKEVFQFFKNTNITNFLQSKYGKYNVNNAENVDITLQFTNPVQINFEKLFEDFNSANIQIQASNQQITIPFGFNKEKTIAILKRIINETKGTKLKENSQDTRYLSKYIREGLQNQDIFSFEGDYERFFISGKQLSNGPYANKKEDFEQMSDSTIRNLTQQIKIDIYQNCNYFNASSSMRQAIDITWQEKINNKDAILYFMRGGDMAQLAGAFGEFQVALLNNYLLIRSGNNNSQLRAIIADNLKSGEQQKVDVSILNNIGIQVKNINQFTAGANNGEAAFLKTNIHPANFQQYSSTQGLDFYEFIANWAINKTFAEQHQGEFSRLEEVLQSYFAEIANMVIEDSLDDKVTFYLVGGNKLIPCSYIMRIANNFDALITKPVEITSGFNKKTDIEWKSGGKNAPFIKIWHSTVRGEGNQHNLNMWEHDFVGEGVYDNLMNKLISIRSGFNYIEYIKKVEAMASISSIALF